MVLDASCLTLSNMIRIKGKWSNPGKGVSPSSAHRCSSYWKRILCVALDYRRPTYLYIYVFTNPFAQAEYEHTVYFLCRFKQFWIKSFPSPRSVAIQRLPYYFTHCWRENNWIFTFPKGISAVWNSNSLVLVLNLGRRVYFLRWYPLQRERL